MKTNITLDLVVLTLALVTYQLALKKKESFISELFKTVPFLSEQKSRLFREILTESLKVAGAYLAIYYIKSKL